MAWKKFVALLFLSACVTSTRGIDICVLDVPSDAASCAKKSKQYKKTVGQLVGWYAMDELSYQIIGDKIAQCNVDGKLPKEDIFFEIELCRIEADNAVCTLNNDTVVEDKMHIHQWFATDDRGLQKIKAKLDYCMRGSR